MKLKTFLLLTLLLSGLMILSACAPTAAPEDSQSEEAPGAAYPAPAEKEAASKEDDSAAYPAPETPKEAALSQDPYPGVEKPGSVGEWNLSEALMVDDFTIVSSDKDWQEGPVFIDAYDVVMKESSPVQVNLVVTGNLPTPCNHLRIVTADPDKNGNIAIKAYTVVDPDMMCTQVLKPFVAVVPLGDYAKGTYTFTINDELSGDFQIP